MCIHAAAHYFCIVWFEPNFKLIQKDLKMLERKRKTDSFSPSHPFWFWPTFSRQPTLFPSSLMGRSGRSPTVPSPLPLTLAAWAQVPGASSSPHHIRAGHHRPSPCSPRFPLHLACAPSQRSLLNSRPGCRASFPEP